MGLIVELLPILVGLLEQAPQVVDSVEQIWNLATSKEAPTPDQQAQIDAALEEAHKALQDS
jgi:hypothetical protein